MSIYILLFLWLLVYLLLRKHFQKLFLLVGFTYGLLTSVRISLIVIRSHFSFIILLFIPNNLVPCCLHFNWPTRRSFIYHLPFMYGKMWVLRIILFFFFVCLVGIFDESFLFANNFEQKVDIFKIRNREIPHKIFSI